MQRFKRGQVWWCKDFAYRNRDSIQSGTRPVVIVSNDINNRASTVVQVAPCTKSIKKHLPTHCTLYLDGARCTVLCEQMKAVSVSTLHNYRGTLDEKELEYLDTAIEVSVGLKAGNNTYIDFDEDLLLPLEIEEEEE